MFTIIIGIAVAIIVIIVFASMARSETTGGLAITIGTLIAFLAIIAGGFYPISGYKEWELVEETELISLSNDLASGGTGFVYVSLSADNVYTYRYEIDFEFDTETSRAYRTTTIANQDVVEIEDQNCETPMLRVYKRDGKQSIWTFALLSEQTKYVFYVPEGTISKEVKLN